MDDDNKFNRNRRADDVRAIARADLAEKHEVSLIGAFKLLIFLVVVLIVMVLGSFLRSYVVQDAADKATEAAEHVDAISVESRDASLESLRTLREILSDLEEGRANEPDLNNQAVIDALVAIARIEGYLCGGRCPDGSEP